MGAGDNGNTGLYEVSASPLLHSRRGQPMPADQLGGISSPKPWSQLTTRPCSQPTSISPHHYTIMLLPPAPTLPIQGRLHVTTFAPWSCQGGRAEVGAEGGGAPMDGGAQLRPFFPPWFQQDSALDLAKHREGPLGALLLEGSGCFSPANLEGT